MNQIELRMNSKHLMMKTDVCILMPEMQKQLPDPGASPKTYKTLWLLHGATCDYKDFLYQDKIVSMVEDKNWVVVIPNALNSDYANHMEFAGGYAYMDFFFGELMPYIQSYFPVSDAPADNYIAGYSMGGAGTLMYALEHPERFGKAAVLGASMREYDFLEPYLKMSGNEFRKLALSDPRKFPTEYGVPSLGITRKEINMIARYETVEDYVNSPECTSVKFWKSIGNSSLPEMLFGCGDKDECFEKVKKIEAEVVRRNIPTVHFKYLPDLDHSRGDEVIRCAMEWLASEQEA